MCGNQRILDAYLIVGFYLDVVYDAAVIIGRIMYPVGIVNGQVAFLFIGIERPFDLQGKNVVSARFYMFGNIQVNDAERPNNLCGVGNQHAVEPNVCFIIDALQLKHHIFSFFRSGQLEHPAEPPGAIQVGIL